MLRRSVQTLATAAFLAAAANAVADIRINEININPPGTDQGREYAEFISTTGGIESLSNLWFIGIDGDGINAGVIDFAKNLGSFSTGANGLFLLRDTTDVLNPAPAPATPVGIDDYAPDIENGSQTFLLVRDFTGAVGLDLDANDDGVIDAPGSVPWSVIVDGVGFYEESLPDQTDEIAYAAQLGFAEFPNPLPPTTDPNVGFTPDILFRTSDGLWLGADLLLIDITLPLAYDSGQIYPVTTTDVGDVIDLRGLLPQSWTPGDVNPTLTTVEDAWAAGDGDWSNPNNWANSVAPLGFNVQATLGSTAVAPTSINLDVDITLDRLRFDNAISYTISSNNLSVLRFSGLSPDAIVVATGQHTISAGVKFAKSAAIDVVTGAGLTISGPMTFDAGKTLTKTGGGQAVVPNVRAAGLDVAGGTLKVAADGGPGGVSVVQTLTIGSAGRLDLTNNGLVVDYAGPSPVGDVRAAILAGRAGGTWTGFGLTSSEAQTNATTHAVGYAEAAGLALTEFLGQTVDGTSVVARYTRLGDANLDGTTGIADFSRLAANFNLAGAWASGDFNYDGQVGIGDFSLLAANFNQSAALGARGAAVPEPTAMMGVLLAAACVTARRRR